MRILTTAKLSQHKYKTPEGYLVCVDSILSRTGKQQYRRAEVWGDSCDRPEEIVDIDRTSSEVFSDAALASFENKPLTIDHPGVEVNPDNHRELSVGFVRDIKKGVVDGQEVMLGTLVVTDSEAIKLIEDGTYTDLSCGYDCDIEDEENPTQKNIRGNHVALCEEGRAGIARIVDSVNDKIDEDKKDHIIKYFKIWGKPGPGELQEVVNFYRIDRKNGIEIFKALGGYDMDQVEKLKFYDSNIEDAYEQMKMPKKDKDFIKNYLRMISTFTSRDTDISDILRPLYGHGYKCVIEKIDGWHDPKGAYAYKNYTVSFENYIDRFNVTLYADPNQDWKVKEVNAYFLDSNIVDANRYVLAKRKNSYDEYVVRAYRNGKYFEESTYYTDDWDDAVGTLEDIAKREGLTVKKTATGYVAD